MNQAIQVQNPLDASPNLGSLYDTQTRRFVKHTPLFREPTCHFLKEPPTAHWWRRDENDAKTSFGCYLEDQDQLFLNHSWTQPDIGRQNCHRSFNHDDTKCDGSFYLLYTSKYRDQFLPLLPYRASLFFHSETFLNCYKDTLASHILHRIQWGIEVLFAIRIPSEKSNEILSQNVISLLDKICSILTQPPSSALQLTIEDQSLWSKLHWSTFLNSPQHISTDRKDIAAIVRWIQRLTCYQRLYQHPLVYKFKPIEWLSKPEDSSSSEDSHDNATSFTFIRTQLFRLNNAYYKAVAYLESLERHHSSASVEAQNRFQKIDQLSSILLVEVARAYQNVRDNEEELPGLLKVLTSPQYEHICQMAEAFQNTPMNPSSGDALDEPEPNEERKIESTFSSSFIGNFSDSLDQSTVRNDDDSSASNLQPTTGRNSDQTSNEFETSLNSQHVKVSLIPEDQSDENIDGDHSDKYEKVNVETDRNPNSIQIDDSKHLANEHSSHTEQFENDIPSPREETASCPDPGEDTQLKPFTSNVEFMNVVLIGQSGVGKSTFVNAFVNYLVFNSLTEAKSGKPIVLIPVSFLVTSGFDFQERTIKFGEIDINEDYDHPGQSVTQECRSYTFRIHDNLRLRIIDTPGVGDTRGLEQDEENIDHTLSFINQFTYLHAICILLPPNITRMEIFFRLCLLRLFAFLSDNARDNVIFCFTNTRSTFYTPGNTGPLLRSFLKSLSIAGIPFDKTNSFSFDSESFRYLACIQSGLEFDECEEEVYVNSWEKSVTESIRFLKKIRSLKPYQIGLWRSEGHARVQIQMLIRPIMEAFRIILVNEMLKSTCPKVSLALRTESIEDPRTILAICYGCSPEQFRVEENFSTFKYSIHPFHQHGRVKNFQCDLCDCSSSDHELIDYKIDYEITTRDTMVGSEPAEDLETYSQLMIDFARFLGSIDPFLIYFQRFIDAENFIAPDVIKTSSTMLSEMVEKLHTSYVNQAATTTNLDETYRKIEQAQMLPSVALQLEKMKKRRLHILQNQEKYIEIPDEASTLLTQLINDSVPS